MADLEYTNPYALLEAPRALYEMGTIALTLPLLNLTPRGDGHGVFVIPGFGASDRSTFLSRRFLDSRGYRTSGWTLGRNLGLQRIGGTQALIQPFLEFQRRMASKVSIIGWSLGGVHGRRIARSHHELVRQLICLGSPIQAVPAHSPVYRVYESVNVKVMDNVKQARMKDAAIPLKVPSTAIFSKSDGVVPWQLAIDMNTAQSENIEVFGSHIGLGVSPSVFYLLANRLAQPDGQWNKFERNHWKNLLALALLDPMAPLYRSGALQLAPV